MKVGAVGLCDHIGWGGGAGCGRRGGDAEFAVRDGAEHYAGRQTDWGCALCGYGQNWQCGLISQPRGQVNSGQSDGVVLGGGENRASPSPQAIVWGAPASANPNRS